MLKNTILDKKEIFFAKNRPQFKKMLYFCSRFQENKIKSIMYLTQEKKQEIFNEYGKNANDTGSAEAQIALFTYRIQHLTELMKKNKKDQVSERALVGLVGKRRRMLDYLKDTDIERYRAIIKKLNLRK